MDLSSSLEMSRASDEMPDLNLDFSNFDLSQFVTADDNATMGTQHLHMHSISAPHSANTSPMLNPVQDYSGGYSTSQVVNNNEVARLQHHLEQQRRLNELNQLQNRILQQQLEIMGSQPPTSHVHVGYQGLMTPVSSTELRPTMYDANMIQGLSNALGNNQDLIRSLLSPAVTPNMVASSSHSHPSPFPTSHGTPTDFFSPLTSPALGPSPNPTHSFRPSPAIPSPAQSTFPSLPSPSFGPTRQKRGAGALSDVEIARKRASPIVKPTPPPKSSATTKRTPRMRARADSIAQPQPRASPLPSPRPSGTIEPVGDVPNSTPSPVDISTTLAMPPPVVPFARTGAGSGGSGEDVAMDLGGSSADGTPVASAGGSPSLAPVTPASLMNLGHIATRPTGLMHSGSNSPGESQKSSTTTQTAGTSKAKSAGSTGGSNRKEKDRTKDAEQAKGAPKGKVPIAKAGGGRPSPAILPMISPAIKPHLPGGLSAEAIAHLSTKSNYQNNLEGRGVALGIASSSSTTYGPDGRKTSHKAAEQKRRDSLKAGFDDLRLLLPPIALAACAELDPGAAPPRGPPRNVPGGEDNPNRAVSKLALLRFSNEWIVKLGRRVERRDTAIDELKDEVKMLREKLASLGISDVGGGFDFDADLDAVEEDKEENTSARAASRPTEKLKAQSRPDAIAEQDEEEGDDAE